MIDIRKRYRCNASYDVRLVYSDGNYVFGYVGGRPYIFKQNTGALVEYNAYASSQYYLLTEVSPYEGIAIDTPVWVKIDDNEWQPRHFAGVDETGFPRAWDNGTTSHTSNGDSSVWHELTTTKPKEGE